MRPSSNTPLSGNGRRAKLSVVTKSKKTIGISPSLKTSQAAKNKAALLSPTPSPNTANSMQKTVTKSLTSTPDPADLCVVCNRAVEENSDSMACDHCDKFTHPDCCKNLPKPSYLALNSHEDNPLIYLCHKCKPVVLQSPIQPSGLKDLAKIEAKITKLFTQLEDQNKITNSLATSLQEEITKINKLLIPEPFSKLQDMLKEVRKLAENVEHINRQINDAT